MSEAWPRAQVTGLGVLTRIYVTGPAFYLACFFILRNALTASQTTVIPSLADVNSTESNRKAKPSVSKALLNLSD